MSHVLILHSHFLDADGKPGAEYVARLSYGLEEIIRKRVDHILLTGGVATPGVGKVHSEVAREWLIENDIPGEVLTTEKTGSRETVGELIFARTENDESLLGNENRITILSSDYHIARLDKIARHVFGERTPDLIGIPGFYRDPEAEKRSLEAFSHTFAGTKIGDIRALEERLWKAHPLYRDHPSNPYR